MFSALHTVTLIGVGLIGGSFMLDLKRHKLVQHVIGIDLDCENLTRAIERRVIDEADTEITAQNIQAADLVMIATPVATLPQICQQLAPLLLPHTIVSDVGSTKQTTIDAFKQFLPHHLSHCVATHPIAGSDRSGALAAQFGLYQNKKLILCPHEQQDIACLTKIEQLWQQVGACTYQLTAQQHDHIFAAVSHLPHLLAFAYMRQLLDDVRKEEYLHFAGSGFRDFTRIAASNPYIWADIMLANRESLLPLIQLQQQQLNQLAKYLTQQDKTQLIHYLQSAQMVREQWQENG